MQSYTEKLLCLRGGTVLHTVVYTSERLLRQLEMPSLAYLLQLISAGSAFVTGANMQVDLIVGNSLMAP